MDKVSPKASHQLQNDQQISFLLCDSYFSPTIFSRQLHCPCYLQTVERPNYQLHFMHSNLQSRSLHFPQSFIRIPRLGTAPLPSDTLQDSSSNVLCCKKLTLTSFTTQAFPVVFSQWELAVSSSVHQLYLQGAIVLNEMI